MNQASLSPMSALFAHLEPILDGRRVLFLGNATTSSAAHVLERGARLVQVLDPDSRRVASAASQNTERRITFAQLTPHSLRDGSFDLVLVEDIELVDNVDGLVQGVKRSLNSSGIAVFCARNSEGTSGLLGASRGKLSHDEFCDALWDQFENVTLWGQSPFLGYSVVQFGLQNPPEPGLDNGFIGAEGELPDYYVAICDSGAELPVLCDMSIVQLPSTRVLLDSDSGHRDNERRASRRVETLQQELAQLRKRVGNSEVERLTKLLEERDTWIRQLESRAIAADGRADDAEAEVDELEQELEKTHRAVLDQSGEIKRLTTENQRLSEQRKEAQTRLTEAERFVGELRKHEDEVTHLSAGRKALEDELNALSAKNEKLEKQAAEQRENIARLQKRIASLDTEVDELHRQLNETDEFLRDAEDELKDTQTKLASAAASTNEKEVSDLEEQLTERGRRVLELENQLRKLENYCRTLKAELSQPSSESDGTTQAELEQLARTLAEREADLVEAQWTIGQLQKVSKN